MGLPQFEEAAMNVPEPHALVSKPAEVAPPDTGPELRGLIAYLEHDAVPSLLLDPEFNILAANTAYQRQFGCAGQGCVGHKCYRVSHHYDVPCDQAGEQCPMKMAQASRAPHRVLHIHHTPRGPEHVDVELRPIMDAAGRFVAFVERLNTVRSASVGASADGLVGRSPAFMRALLAVQRVAPSALPVLLQGESGTGKELFARAVHEASDRAAGPFVVVDCSGLTETLFESELFGHEKGAFTGAQLRKQGLVETAQGGTLFLDEIGDLPLSMQVKLLRLIETSTFRRVGGLETQRADFRLVAATHQPLQTMVADGRFRQDLYYRISAFPIHLPPLRERLADIPVLVDSMLQRSHGGSMRWRVDEVALRRLQVHAWPGNIRELRNAIERARLFTDDGVIRLDHLPPELVGAEVAPAVRAGGTLPQAASAAARAGRKPGAEVDAGTLAKQLAACTGTRRDLAQALGLSERTLYRRLKALQR